MARRNRSITLQVRLIDIDDEQHDAVRDLLVNTAQDLHASLTLVCGSKSRPRVFVTSERWMLEVTKPQEEET